MTETQPTLFIAPTSEWEEMTPQTAGLKRGQSLKIKRKEKLKLFRNLISLLRVVGGGSFFV